MKHRTLSHMARALALVLLVVGVAVLAAGNAAWASPSQDAPMRRPGRSTVPRRGTDLEISQSYRREEWDDVIFTIVVRNNGPIAAQDVVVIDGISRRLELEEVATSKGSCRGEPLVRCSLGNLAVGEVVTITIRAAVWLDRYRGTITNTATVTSKTRDTKPSNNSARVSFNGRNIHFPWFDD